jgi:hypothetical protein
MLPRAPLPRSRSPRAPRPHGDHLAESRSGLGSASGTRPGRSARELPVNRPQIDMSFRMLLGCRAHLLILGAQAADRVIEASVRITSRLRLGTLDVHFSQIALVGLRACSVRSGRSGCLLVRPCREVKLRT